MMDLNSIFKQASKAVMDNSSVILTGAAVAGTVTTAIFAAKGHGDTWREEMFEYASDINHGEYETPEGLEFWKKHYRHYIPAAISGTTTIACIVGIHSVNSRRQAALISAYTAVDKAFENYRSKVQETVGDKQESQIRDELAKDRLDANPVVGNEVILTGTGEQLCYDSLTGRYFKSDMETIRKAQNDINAQVLHDMYCSQNEFYEKIGLGPSAVGEELGWTTDRLMDIEFSTHLSEDGRPCISLNYIPTPVRNYWRLGS